MRYFIFLFIVFAGFVLNAQETSITAIQGLSSASPYVNQEVTTRGIVTATYGPGYFIQDGDSAWSAVYVYDSGNHPLVGDSVRLSARVLEYYNFTELSELVGYQVINSGNLVPDPILIETGEAAEKWESVLVRVESATCTNPDMGYGEWGINDGSGSLVIGDMGVAYSPIAGVKYAVAGPLNYSYSLFKIEPRGIDDIQIDEPLFFTVLPSVGEITTTSIDISWETNAEAASYIAYGLTPDLELDTIGYYNSTTSHMITIDGLDANAFYYVKPFSVAESDTTISNTMMVATASTSTGAMKVYFNHSVDTMVAWQNNAVAVPGAFVDTIINFINLSQSTLDITMYDIIDTSENQVIRIMNAINAAYERGVTVRYITDDQPENPLLEDLHPDIDVLAGNTEAIMHDKFMIVDAESIDNSWVLTGSTNHTIANLYTDYNNIICVQDHQLAKAYRLEFNEMWGSETATSNAATALFGADKTDNTPHCFNVGGIRMELYFSPSDKTTSNIANAINHAEVSVNFGVLVFTEDQLGTAILNAYDRGVNVHGIVDYVEYSGDEFHMLLNNGVDVVNYINEDGSEWPEGATFHHKYAVIDQNTDNAILITGSHNWSASAESRNDENTLIIYDRNMANLYYQEFTRRFAEQKALLGVDEMIDNQYLSVYPNPSNGYIYVTTDGELYNAQYEIVDMQGRRVLSGAFQGNVIRHQLLKGLYILRVLERNTSATVKFIVE